MVARSEVLVHSLTLQVRSLGIFIISECINCGSAMLEALIS